MARRQLVILSRHSGPGGELAPIGPRREIEAALAGRNTAAERPGGDTLYGPGIELELAPGEDPVMQMQMTLSDEDIAWDVILRLVRDFHWKLFDPATGRELAL